MIKIRASEDRGITKTDWLLGKHSFSFGQYYDTENMNFGVLRVINEDVVKAGKGFHTHPHRDMEIITYILSGALEHKDSLGTGSVIVPNDVQRMSAGTGILHSEFNPLHDKDTHLLQIWITPEKTGIAPSYEQKNFALERKPNQLTLIASRDGRDGSVTIHQKAEIFVLDLETDKEFEYEIADGRMVWLQMARGEASLGEKTLKQGDGVAIRAEKSITLKATETTEILIFDLPNV